MRFKLPATLSLLALNAFIMTQSNTVAGPRFAQGDVTFSGTVSINDTTRASPNALGRGDTYYAFTPAIQYNRETARLNLNANLSLPYRRYEEQEFLDSDGIDFSLNGNVPFGTGPRLSGNWSVNYSEGVQASYLTNRNLDSERFGVRLSSNYRLRNRLSLRAGVGYNERSNQGVLEIDNYDNENRTTYYYGGVRMNEILGTLGAYVDYRVQYRDTLRGENDQNVDDKDGSIIFGLTGQILPERWFPNLDADVSFGFQNTSPVGDSDRSETTRLTVDGYISYPATSKSDVRLDLSRNIRVSDDDRTVEQTDITLGINYRPRQKWTVNGSAGLRYNDFLYDGEDPRNDEVFIATLSTRYSIRPNWYATLSYNFRDSDSNRILSDYSSRLITLSTTIQY